MTSLLEYLFKSSLGIALFSLFYLAALRRLTFYRVNRFYFFGAILMSMTLPLLNITRWLPSDQFTLSHLPLIGAGKSVAQQSTISSQLENIFSLVAAGGIALMAVLFIIKSWSLKKVRRRSFLLIELNTARVFGTSERINPFSFDRSIFVNPSLHSETELEQIIQHELVHVQEKHTIDLLLAEFLCMINWFNPFAWILRRELRQNLEYLADREVLSNGIDKQQYQYLLLNFVANTQYMLANNFSLSNLKNRIIMMNKKQTTRHHLLKLAFLIPVIAAVGIACGKNDQVAKKSEPALIGVTVPDVEHVPLTLVDGVPQPASYYSSKSLDPEKIESITVWKNEAAIQKFGDRAKNGVIDITMKK